MAPTAGVGPEWYRGLVQEWFRALARRGRARKTQRTYGNAVRDFGRWLEHTRMRQPQDLFPAVVQTWQDQLVERGLQPASLGVYATAVRGLLRWAAREGKGIPPTLWEHVETPRRPETLPRALAPEHLARIMAHLAQEIRGLDALRTRALFLFLLTTGSRISAALSLNRDQLAGEQLLVVQKGGGQHVLLPSATSRAWTEQYLRARGRDEQPALWIRVGRQGRHRLTLERVNGIWAELAQELRIPHFTSHALRHTAVTELGARGVSDSELAQHVGWKSTAMALRYRQLREDRRQELVDQLDQLIPPAPALPQKRRRSSSMKALRPTRAGRGKRS